MIVGGWLEKTLMKSGVLLAFRKGKYFFVARLKVTSKKSVSIRFVSMVIESPSSLNNEFLEFPNSVKLWTICIIYCSKSIVSI